MKSIDEYLQEHVKPIDFDKLLQVGKVNLFEVEDPLAGGGMGGATNDTAPATDPLGGGNPLGDSNPMDTPVDNPPKGDPNAGFNNAESADEEEEDDHEDDPDWTKGVKDSDNVTLSDKPAGESIYDGESVIKSIAAVRASKPEEELKSMDKVQKALELIVNGKKLKLEDVEFEDPEDAMELINAIEEPLDIKLKNYLDLKIKQPIILQRDKNKTDMAQLAADNEKARDAIDAMNKTEDKEQK